MTSLGATIPGTFFPAPKNCGAPPRAKRYFRERVLDLVSGEWFFAWYTIQEAREIRCETPARWVAGSGWSILLITTTFVINTGCCRARSKKMQKPKTLPPPMRIERAQGPNAPAGTNR
ncbi:hypothetical protein BJY52DRAFT_1227276 [Lactarius psammicola]|nr:hypothetical protein BJY52DRAFT_1227276 [Lactarius psammicola]